MAVWFCLLFVLAVLGFGLVALALFRFHAELHFRVSLPLVTFEFRGRSH